ncbi:replicative DNA helicase [Gallionella capsiferriformans]|uniref:Replicative DNA helicase n=1 Tax=Gallionella capsiferriformans (strain ES-2) TaxID=395494 RepID=D9SHU7_GALCS|nr:replicative DNA helicase [Gallionella capsiferriformans]ADL56037.1 replicative DNA helicase [Gallionella capsiferriformans ES-2]
MNYQPDETILPPHSVEAEQSVIGAVLLDSNALDRIEGQIAEADFYRQDHRLIFAAARTLANAGKPVDVITVAEALEGSGSLSRAGGLAYLGEIAQNTPSAANIKRYAEIVREHAMRRNLLALATDIQASCIAPGADVARIIDQADAAMAQLIDTGTDEPTMLYDGMFDAIQDIDDRSTGRRPSGLLTGVAELDAITGGLEPGQLIIVAARPSVGKTAIALNVVDSVVTQGKSVAFFSLEMTRREIIQRLIALRTGVPVSAMRAGRLEPEQWDLISASQGKANGQRLHLIDRSSIGVAYVRAAARKIKRQHGLDLVVVDYLGLMRGEGHNRTQEIGSLSRGLKGLAKELGVPIIALAQLNRATETRQDKRPMLSDLRDSGEIEQDADIVAMLHREEQHNPAPEWRGLADVMVRKNRNGPLGEMLLTLDGPTMKFSRYAGSNPRQRQQQQPSQTTYSNNRNARGFDD